jgi:hypothetical protein
MLINSQVTILKSQVPNSQYSLGENPKFFKVLDLKITRLKKNFDKHFCLLPAIVIQACHSKVKTITLLCKIVYLLREN